MEPSGKRFIRIGKTSIGLIGLNQALNQLLSQTQLSEEEAVCMLFEAIKKLNYIPDNIEAQYKEALRQEYRRAQKGTTCPQQTELVIRVLGKPCISCNRLGEMVIEALNSLKIAADIEQIHDPDEIWRYGILNTPALIINNEIKSAGRLPSLAEVEQWLSEAASYYAAHTT